MKIFKEILKKITGCSSAGQLEFLDKILQKILFKYSNFYRIPRRSDERIVYGISGVIQGVRDVKGKHLQGLKVFLDETSKPCCLAKIA